MIPEKMYEELIKKALDALGKDHQEGVDILMELGRLHLKTQLFDFYCSIAISCTFIVFIFLLMVSLVALLFRNLLA